MLVHERREAGDFVPSRKLELVKQGRSLPLNKSSGCCYVHRTVFRGTSQRVLVLFGCTRSPSVDTRAEADAIRNIEAQWLADTLVCKTLSETVDTVDVSASGDLAYIRGTIRFSYNSPKGVVGNVGTRVAIYKKIDGQWRVTVDISNSDKPLGDQ